MKPITILLVDDHAVMRMGLASLLETCGDVEVIGDTGDGTHQPNHVLHQACQIAHPMSFPLIHPPYLMPNLAYDQFYSQNIMLQPPSGLRRAMVKFAKTIIPPDGVAWLKSKLKRN